jgi:transposase
MAASKTDTRLGEQYRRTARRRGKQKGIVAVSRVICEISWLLISDRGARFTDPGPGYNTPASPQRRHLPSRHAARGRW